MKKTSILLPLILLGYAFLYIATSKRLDCDGDCEKMVGLQNRLLNNRPYVVAVNRLEPYNNANNKIYVFVRDTTGIDWNRLADTTCLYSHEVGFAGQQIFVLRAANTNDTLSRLNCP